MKNFYFSLLVFFISASVFAGGWVQDFSSGRPAIYINESQASDNEWYLTGVSAGFPFPSAQSQWKTAWSLPPEFKPTGSFIFLDGTQGALAAIKEFSLVSPAFVPAANVTDLYYKIQEIRISNEPNSKAEELYLDVAAKEGDAWTWTVSSDNVLANLNGYNASTTLVAVFQKSLSDYADKEIKIRFRGKVDAGNSVAVLYSVALVDNTVSDLSVNTSQNIISQIPKKHANQVTNASVQNRGKTIAAGVAAVTATTTAYTATASVPDLTPLETAALTFATPFAPQAFGDYRFQYILSGDNNTANNTATSNTFAITPNTFASDKGPINSYINNTTSDLGNKFTLAVADTVESISIGWAKLNSNPSSLEFQLVIYALDAADVLNPTPVYTSATLTRPDNATTPANDRLATFESYPVNQNLVAGDYIFAVRSTVSIGLGGEWDEDRGVYYEIDRTNGNKLLSTAGRNLLIRVNTASDITLSPAVSSLTAGINEPLIIAGSAITGLAASPAITIKKADNSTNVTNIAATYAGGKVTITHAAFEFNTTYTVTVPANTLTGYERELTWSFTTVSPLTPKTFSPTNGAANVALDATLSVSFDRNIPEESTLEGITVATDEETPVAVSGVSATKNGSVLTIAHNPFEKRSTKYKVTIPASAISELTADTFWVFTTIPPVGLATFSPFWPSDGKSDVELTTEIWVNFNQAVDSASSTLAGITINGNAVAGASLVNSGGIACSRLEIDRSNLTFEQNTRYEVIIPAGAIAGYDAEIKWSFTSFLPLAVVAYTPATGTTETFLGTEISVEFNKENFFIQGLNRGEITITPAGGEPLSGVDCEKDAVNKKLLISHTDPLRPNTEYTINIPDDVVPKYNGVSDWTFTTESAPEIVGVTPENGAENVAVHNTVEVIFNKTIALGNTDDIRINDAAPTSVSRQFDTNLRLNHAAFTQGTEYTVTIPAGSVVGYDRDTTWSFTTVPVLTWTVSPANNATGVALDAPLKIEFSRAPLRPGNPSGDITISGNNGESITVPRFSWNTSTGNDTVTIDHAVFDLNVTYTVTVPVGAILDAGETSETSISWSFTTTDNTGFPEIKNENGIYPTLTKGDITVVADRGSLIKIVDIAGVVRATYRSIGKQSPIHLNGATGLYLVVVNGKTYKVVLQK